jgi:predicted nucleic acid-binding protein
VEGPSPIVIADTSVLINFLAINRMDLIERHSCRFLITDQVRQEITEHYQEQFSHLKEVLEQGILEEISVTDPEEVEAFAKLTELESFGHGECACIAVALHRSYTLAIDDKKAIKQARLSCPTIRIATTEDLMVSMINTGLITVNEADAIKDEWALSYKFKLKISSFADLL